MVAVAADPAQRIPHEQGRRHAAVGQVTGVRLARNENTF
jgi:hypothetical protein